jgi:manganese/zinc/iron transport system ATP- binding protein
MSHERSKPILRVEDLTVSYGAEPALESISFEVDRHQLVGIVGPNGSGKTTLLRSILGLVARRSGQVEIAGKRGRKSIESVSYVPQRADIDWDFPLTVEDVVTQGRYGTMGLLSRPSSDDRRRIDEAIDRVGIEPLRRRQIGELSGGQQQRTFLARALAQDGSIYLLDEPFQGVDATTERAIVDVLQELRDRGRSALVVHHDLSTVKDYFDHVLLLNRRVIAHGPVDDVFEPEALQEAYGGRLTFFDRPGQLAVFG